ncbi:hypothetical protein CDEST_08459 [Colletotrichum destructivum]|uniref:Uncharacterized protein n=1 Tax=Colletotrichum destructivum TaxID=34406 RepID=A0AAX4IK96_9PEZI|nr:hypothetical protein CDEST_08459 [Colletotrichum destructivum]
MPIACTTHYSCTHRIPCANLGKFQRRPAHFGRYHKVKGGPFNGPHTPMPTAFRSSIGPDGAAVPMVGVRVRRQTAFSRIQDNLACLSRATHTF